jgi:chemotaxis protein MotB
LAGSNGMFGGKSIIDPEDGFPFTAKQTALLERLTPQSEGGPNADNGSSQEEHNREGPQDDAPSGAGGSSSKQQDKENYDKLEKDIKQKLQENKQLQGMKDQVNIVREKDGLRIEVIDKADYSMFSSGTADMNGKAANLIKEVAKSLKDMPNKVSVRGHTDSQGFAPDSLRNNWSLSSERADSTRQILQGAGINANRFKSIEGVADTAPYVPNNPADPRNRRVSITVLNQ